MRAFLGGHGRALCLRLARIPVARARLDLGHCGEDKGSAEPPAEPASGAFIASAGVDEVATWYRDALEATGKSTLDLSSPLEDGSRVLDMQGDLPECRLRLTFRPAGESTMITVLVAAGCASVEG